VSDSLKHLPSPDPRIVRARLKAAAKAGEIPVSPCPHPVSAIQQYIDEVATRDRYSRPTNLFECMLCHQQLRLVDFNGKDAKDG
jgi:hypothetical protein